MLNKKGFTLIELLAMMVVLGLVMAVAIPNIMGITEANRKQQYAEDALKFKDTVEYKLRSDVFYTRPEAPGECVVVSLTHLIYSVDPVTNNVTFDDLTGTEYEDAPYEGEYQPNYSYVVMKKEGDEYKYYVQLIELKDSQYRGVELMEHTSLEGAKYLDAIDGVIEDFDSTGFVITGLTRVDDAKAGLSCGCTNVKKIYYGAPS